MLGYKSNLLDPYNRNVLKADRPVFGSWFFNLGLIAESVFESRDLPTGDELACAERWRQRESRRPSQQRAVEVEEGGGVCHYFLTPAAVKASPRLA